MYAIIETGGKQFKVSQGDVIKVEKLDVEAGDDFVFDKVIAVSNDNGFSSGSPYLADAAVKASVVKQDKARKVIIYKYKAKKGFHKKKGHRQPYTELKIESIEF